MALLLPHSVFFHMPKTGGTWVREAIKSSGIPTNEAIDVRTFDLLPSVESAASRVLHSNGNTTRFSMLGYAIRHATYDEVQTQGKFTFSFVRHPLTYYQSYWAYKCQEGWDTKNTDDIAIASETFLGFVENVLRYQQGWYTQKCKMYFGEYFSHVDFIGKQEHLAEDLHMALRLAGETFNESALFALPKKNIVAQKPTWLSQCLYSYELATEVARAEHAVIEAFSYESIPMQVLAVEEYGVS